MADVQAGHEHEQPRAAVISLSEPMVGSLSSDDRRALVEALVDLSRSGLDEDEMVARLGSSFERLGTPQPGPVVARLVENLRGAHEVTIVTDSGQVLYGDPGFDVTRQDTNVDGDEDPEDSDRPAYS